MSETPAACRRRRGSVFATKLAVMGLTTAGALWFMTRSSAQQLFVQGLAAGRRNPAAGERYFRRAIESAGGRYPDAQIALCDALARQGLWDAALPAFADVDIQACRADLLLAFGREALRAEHKPQGLQALLAASRRGNPASVAALELLKAEYHEQAQQEAETAVDFELARLESDNPDRWKALIDILEGQRKHVECEAALREALGLELPDVYRSNFEYLLIRILIARGETSEPRRRIADLKKIEGPSLRVGLTEIDLYRFEGRYDLALAKAAALASDAPDMHALHHIRGVLHLELEQYEQAAHDLERAIALRPFDESIHFRLSEAYRALRCEELSARHRQIAAEITHKRKRINDLKQQRSERVSEAALVDELAELHQELGEDQAARFWRERARLLVSSRRKQP